MTKIKTLLAMAADVIKTAYVAATVSIKALWATAQELAKKTPEVEVEVATATEATAEETPEVEVEEVATATEPASAKPTTGFATTVVAILVTSIVVAYVPLSTILSVLVVWAVWELTKKLVNGAKALLAN